MPAPDPREVETLTLPKPPFVIDETTDPFAIIRHLLEQANQGDEGLTMLRRYCFVRELGKGGMGAVALIRHDEIKQELAIKMMLPGLAAETKFKEKFEREIEICKALRHPHVVPLRDWGRWRDIHFFTSDYCDGGDVEHFRAQHGGKLSPQEARPIIFQTLDALDYAHHAEVRVKLKDGTLVEADGVVHRDVKPLNIFLCESGTARITKLGDYGLAKAFATAGETGQTSQGQKGGSIWFMPQQLLDNFLYAKPDVDVWATAATLYYLLTGKPPRDFANEPPQRWLWVVSTKPPIPIRQRDGSIPPKLAEVIDHALDDKDQLHFPSAAEFKQALENVL